MQLTTHVLHKKYTPSPVHKKTVSKSVQVDTKTKRKTSSLYIKKIKRYTKQGAKNVLLSPVFHSIFKLSSSAAIAVAVLYGSYLYIGKTFANEVIVSQSEIVARVGKLILLPQEEPLDIVRVQDEEELRKQNPFYKNIHEGEYILIYNNLAIIYDLRNNTIIDMKRD